MHRSRAIPFQLWRLSRAGLRIVLIFSLLRIIRCGNSEAPESGAHFELVFPVVAGNPEFVSADIVQAVQRKNLRMAIPAR